eukprot:EG_transcript_24307
MPPDDPGDDDDRPTTLPASKRQKPNPAEVAESELSRVRQTAMDKLCAVLSEPLGDAEDPQASRALARQIEEALHAKVGYGEAYRAHLRVLCHNLARWADLPRLVAGHVSVPELLALPPKQLASAQLREHYEELRETGLQEAVRGGLKFDGLCDVCGRQKVLVMTGHSHWGPTQQEEEHCMCALVQTPGRAAAAPVASDSARHGSQARRVKPRAGAAAGTADDLRALEDRQRQLEAGLDFLFA